MGWRRLAGPAFSLRRTLLSGQVFRWREVEGGGDGSAFVGVLGRQVVELKQDGDGGTVQYRVVVPDASASAEATEAALTQYFNLHVDVSSLHCEWLKSGSTTELYRQWRGVVAAGGERCVYLRVLRQDPHECLFTFLCTQNNNVARITQMVDKFCAAYGEALGEVEGTSWHAFPTLERLGAEAFSGDLEGALRGLGFGYRAKFVDGTVVSLLEKRTDLMSLRGGAYADVLEVLTALPGVGRKVADCVALFSLDQHQVTPIDVHVLRIAKHCLAGEVDFKKTLTPTAYNAVQAAFEKDFGPYAGWVHSMLFHAEMTGLDTSTKRQQQRAKSEGSSSSSSSSSSSNASPPRKRKAQRLPKGPPKDVGKKRTLKATAKNA